MDERDDNLARLYRHAAHEEPPAQVDLAVMDQARRALRQRAWSPFGGNWLTGGAVAAVALLCVVLVVVMQGQPDPGVSPDATTPAEQVPPVEDGRIRLALPPAGAAREAEKAAETGPAVAGRARSEADAAADAPVASAAKPDDGQGPPPPRFDFYRTLPEMQVEAPPPEETAVTPASAGVAIAPAVLDAPAAPVAPAAPAGAPAAEAKKALAETAPAAPETDRPAPPPAAAGPAGAYYLQVGAFRAADFADRFRARLAGLQLPASVEAIELANREVWHRVRVGPYPDSAAAEAVRARLSAEGIDSLLVRPAE